MFSLRHEFPTEWHRFLTTADANGDHVQALSLTKDRFPLLFQGQSLTITGVELYTVPKPNIETGPYVLELVTPGQQAAGLQDGAAVSRLAHKTAEVNVQ